MSELVDDLRSELKDREYREGYDEAFLDHRIATQIRVIREQRNLTQSELAKAAGMKQSRISAIEDQDYGSWSVNTLRRIGYALGVRLKVEFVEWGNLLHDVEHSGREDLERTRFEDDPEFASTGERTMELAAGAFCVMTATADLGFASTDNQSLAEHTPPAVKTTYRPLLIHRAAARRLLPLGGAVTIPSSLMIAEGGVHHA